MDILENILSALAEFGKFLGNAFLSLFSALGEHLSEAMPTFPAISKIFKSMNTPVIIIALFMYLIFVNFAAFFQFRIDKKYAERDAERIPEKTLFKWCFAGGAAGALIAMYMFHHKTRHLKFKLGVPFLLIIEMVFYSMILGFLIYWSFDQ